jgi:hypothetical protein
MTRRPKRKAGIGAGALRSSVRADAVDASANLGAGGPSLSHPEEDPKNDIAPVEAPPTLLPRYKLTKPAFMRATPSATVTALSPGAEIETDVAPSAHWLPLNDAARERPPLHQADRLRLADSRNNGSVLADVSPALKNNDAVIDVH